MEEAKKEILVWCPECYRRKYVNAKIIIPICEACQVTMIREIDKFDEDGNE